MKVLYEKLKHLTHQHMKPPRFKTPDSLHDDYEIILQAKAFRYDIKH